MDSSDTLDVTDVMTDKPVRLLDPVQWTQHLSQDQLKFEVDLNAPVVPQAYSNVSKIPDYPDVDLDIDFSNLHPDISADKPDVWVPKTKCCKFQLAATPRLFGPSVTTGHTIFAWLFLWLGYPFCALPGFCLEQVCGCHDDKEGGFCTPRFFARGFDSFAGFLLYVFDETFGLLAISHLPVRLLPLAMHVSFLMFALPVWDNMKAHPVHHGIPNLLSFILLCTQNFKTGFMAFFVWVLMLTRIASSIPRDELKQRLEPFLHMYEKDDIDTVLRYYKLVVRVIEQVHDLTEVIEQQ
jgi:hypothetical protein